MIFPAQPIYFIQTPKQVLMLYQGNAEVRRIHMNVPHSANPKPSWYGESVGRYEGDTLVIDTIGLNNKTFSTPTARRTRTSSMSSSAGG